MWRVPAQTDSKNELIDTRQMLEMPQVILGQIFYPLLFSI